MLTMGSYLQVLGAALLAAIGVVIIFEVLLRVQARRVHGLRSRGIPTEVQPASPNK
jgi:hypothetical protein